MAKQKTFSDKMKKGKGGDGTISVKVIKGYVSEIGSTKFLEKMVHIDDISQIDKIDIN
ncbi:MAG: hypothetical protein GX372_09395 [Ignavibacteria bacterium]|jgi:hypothetical protein|nr:hypothetical protein [Ignavibacteria bacterium]